MKEHDFQDEVMKILQEVPSARRALLENHDNLLKVSEYCANNYMQVSAASTLAPLRPVPTAPQLVMLSYTSSFPLFLAAVLS